MIEICPSPGPRVPGISAEQIDQRGKRMLQVRQVRQAGGELIYESEKANLDACKFSFNQHF